MLLGFLMCIPSISDWTWKLNGMGSIPPRRWPTWRSAFERAKPRWLGQWVFFWRLGIWGRWKNCDHFIHRKGPTSNEKWETYSNGLCSNLVGEVSQPTHGALWWFARLSNFPWPTPVQNIHWLMMALLQTPKGLFKHHCGFILGIFAVAHPACWHILPLSVGQVASNLHTAQVSTYTNIMYRV